jgi:hypothetical protein
MVDIPTIEPTEIIAGDTLTWKKSLSDYLPGDGYTLKYRLINTAGKLDITATASGSDHLISVTAATTAAYAPGTYTWTSYVEKGSGAELERHTISTGTIKVLPSLATQAAGYDTRSHVKKVLDLIEAAIEALQLGMKNYTITTGGGSRSYTQDDIPQLITLRDKYKIEYQRELDAERLKQGRGSSRRVGVRFNRV